MCHRASVNWNIFILTHKFESSFVECLCLFGYCLQGNIQKCTLTKVVRRILQLFPKQSEESTISNTKNLHEHLGFFCSRTSSRMLTHSNTQEQLGTAAVSYPPTHNPYGYGNSATLLHMRVTALREEYQSDDNASSSSSSDFNASSSPFLPLMQTWTYQMCC